MKMEEISTMWNIDSNIDRNELTTETLRTPNLHSKYLDILMQCKSRLLKYTFDYTKMKEVRTRYYNGELTSDELIDYEWRQYQGIKPLKSAMHEKLDGDSELNKIRMKLQYIENTIYQLESIMYQIKGRDWAIKNHITWLQFQNGA